MTVLLAPRGLPLWRTVYQIYALNGRAFSILTGRAGGLILIYININLFPSKYPMNLPISISYVVLNFLLLPGARKILHYFFLFYQSK